MSYLSVCSTNYIRLYDTSSYDIKYTFQPFRTESHLKNFAVNKDGQLFGVIPTKGPVELAAIKENQWKKYHTLQNILNPTTAVFAKLSKYQLAVGTDQGHVILYDSKTRNVVKNFSSINSPVNLIDVCAKDSHLAVGSDDGNIYMYNIASVKQTDSYKVTSSSKSVSALKFHSTFRSIFAAADDNGTVAVWDINMKKKKFTERGAHCAPCTDIAFSPVNNTLMTSISFDCTFNCYDLQSNEKVLSKLLDNPLCSHDIMHTGNILAISSINGMIYILDLRNCDEILQTFEINNTPLKKILYQNVIPTRTKSLSSIVNMESMQEVEKTSDENESLFTKMLQSALHGGGTENAMNTPPDISHDSFFDLMGIKDMSNSPDDNIEIKITDEVFAEKSSKCDESKRNLNLLDNTVPVENLDVLLPHKIKNKVPDTIPIMPKVSTPVSQTMEGPKVIERINSISESMINEQFEKLFTHIDDLKKEMQENQDKTRQEFMYMKLYMVRQFVYNEERIKTLFTDVMEENRRLQRENNELKTQLFK